jgi:hypothetical protein
VRSFCCGGSNGESCEAAEAATAATSKAAAASATVMSALILKRASLSRPSGQWRDDDYDVMERCLNRMITPLP